MALVLRTTFITTVRRRRMPVLLAPRNDAGRRVVTDAARYRSIGSLQALEQAVVLRIRNGGLVQHVVAVGVGVQLRPELGCALDVGVGGNHR